MKPKHLFCALFLAACGGSSASSIPDPVVDDRIDPVEVGHSWTYDVAVLGTYPACNAGPSVSTTLSKNTIDGKTVFEVQSLCQHAGTFEYVVDGDRVSYLYDGAWRLATDTPVVAGHTWTDDTYSYIWEDAGTQTTLAGTFDHCFTARRQLPYDSYTTFCRGVGPIHWHYEDGVGNGYDAVLTAKSF